MKTILILLIVNLSSYFENNISKINEFKKKAEKNFNEKKYNLAIDNYKYLIDSMNLNDDNVILNLSHSYLLNGDTVNAINGYNSLINSKENKIKSIAYQQLGVISNKYQKLKESSELFKNSIKSNPKNIDSKFNYELVMKKIKEKEENQKEQQNKNQEQQNKNQENQEQQNKKEQQNQENQQQQNQKEQNQKEQNQKEQQNKNQENQQQQNQKEQNQKEQNQKEQQSSIEKKLREINISKEKAEMILEALKNNEVQYLQQLKRKTSKKVDKSKPDW